MSKNLDHVLGCMCKVCKGPQKSGRPKGKKYGPYKKKLTKTTLIRRLQKLDKPETEKLESIKALIDGLFPQEVEVDIAQNN